MSDTTQYYPTNATVSERVARLLQDSRRELAAYGIVDTPEEPAFDDLVELAARISGWPIALLSFFDGRRQWYKSAYGMDIAEDDAAAGFCLNIIAHGHARLYIADAPNDERFRNNPYVSGEPHIRAYIGLPIRSRETGVTLGTLAVCSPQAGTIDCADLKTLELITAQVENLLELRREDNRRRMAEHRLAAANRQLEGFARTVAHDLRAPLRRQASLVRLLRSEFAGNFDGEASKILDRLARSAGEADDLLRDLLDYALVADAASASREDFHVRPFLEEVLALANCPDGIRTEVVDPLDRICAPRVAIKHIALNLVTNAVKHHDRVDGRVLVALDLDGRDYVLSVSDDGPGFPADRLANAFDCQSSGQRLAARLRDGVGSYIIAELTASLGGDIEAMRNEDLRPDDGQATQTFAGGRGTTVRVRWPAL